jgi:hypothetical protein
MHDEVRAQGEHEHRVEILQRCDETMDTLAASGVARWLA